MSIIGSFLTEALSGVIKPAYTGTVDSIKELPYMTRSYIKGNPIYYETASENNPSLWIKVLDSHAERKTASNWNSMFDIVNEHDNDEPYLLTFWGWITRSYIPPISEPREPFITYPLLPTVDTIQYVKKESIKLAHEIIHSAEVSKMFIDIINRMDVKTISEFKKKLGDIFRGRDVFKMLDNSTYNELVQKIREIIKTEPSVDQLCQQMSEHIALVAPDISEFEIKIRVEILKEKRSHRGTLEGDAITSFCDTNGKVPMKPDENRLLIEKLLKLIEESDNIDHQNVYVTKQNAIIHKKNTQVIERLGKHKENINVRQTHNTKLTYAIVNVWRKRMSDLRFDGCNM